MKYMTNLEQTLTSLLSIVTESKKLKVKEAIKTLQGVTKNVQESFKGTSINPFS